MRNDELKNLIIYTGVYYTKSDLYDARSQIWFKTFDNAQKLGIKVVVRNDGGLPPEMLERIKAYPNITIVEKTAPNTLGGGRREALQKAIEIAKETGIQKPIFLWTEPEKDDLVTEKTLLSMIADIRAGSNIAVAERKAEAFAQLPPFQKWVEKRANKRANEIFQDPKNQGPEFDLWFAPKAFDETGAQFFLDYNSNKDKLDLWDAIIGPVIDAVRAGRKVTSVPVDYLYNEIQIKNESDESNREIKIKRMEQYAQILKELGDSKWGDFLREAQNEIAKIKELSRNSSENKEELQETKRSLVKKFFKLK